MTNVFVYIAGMRKCISQVEAPEFIYNTQSTKMRISLLITGLVFYELIDFITSNPLIFSSMSAFCERTDTVERKSPNSEAISFTNFEYSSWDYLRSSSLLSTCSTTSNCFCISMTLWPRWTLHDSEVCSNSWSFYTLDLTVYNKIVTQLELAYRWTVQT